MKRTKNRRPPARSYRPEEKYLKRLQICNEVRLTIFEDNSVELYHYDSCMVDLVRMTGPTTRKLYKELKQLFEDGGLPSKGSKPGKPKNKNKRPKKKYKIKDTPEGAKVSSIKPPKDKKKWQKRK